MAKPIQLNPKRKLVSNLVSGRYKLRRDMGILPPTTGSSSRAAVSGYWRKRHGIRYVSPFTFVNDISGVYRSRRVCFATELALRLW